MNPIESANADNREDEQDEMSGTVAPVVDDALLPESRAGAKQRRQRLAGEETNRRANSTDGSERALNKDAAGLDHEARYDLLVAGFDELLARLRYHELHLASNRESTAAASELLADAETRLREADAAAAAMSGQLDASLAAVKERDERLADAEARLREADATAAATSERLDASLAAVKSLIDQMEGSQAKLDELHFQSSRDRQRLAEASDKIEDLTRTEQTLSIEKVELVSQLATFRSVNDELHRLLGQTEVERGKNLEENGLLKVAVTTLTKQLAERDVQFETLKLILEEKDTLVTTYDGIATSARREAQILHRTIKELHEQSILRQPISTTRRPKRQRKWPWKMPYRTIEPNSLFDESWYLSQYPDVALANMHPLEHYRCFGVKEDRSPNPLFATRWYLEKNLDVAAAGLNPLDHFLKHGAFEGRNPHPLFDITTYLDARRKEKSSTDIGRYWEIV